MFFTILGIAAAVLFLIGDLPYLLDTLKDRTQPQRVTWGVVTILNIIGFANQWASGATNSLWLFAAATLATGSIFIASIKHGVGGHSKGDIIAVALSLLGIMLWIIFDTPLISIIASMLVGLISIIPTFVKAHNNPESETRIAFLFGSISALMTAVSVGELDYQLLVLPIHSFLIQAYIVYLLYVRPAKLRSVTMKS